MLSAQHADKARVVVSSIHFEVGHAVRANDNAPVGYCGRLGYISEIVEGGSEYRVEFEDGQQPTTGYFVSAWLDWDE